MSTHDNSYKAPLFFALFLHAVILLFLLFNFNPSANNYVTTPAPASVVKAVVVEQRQVPAEVERLQLAQPAKQEAELAKQQALQQQVEQVKQQREQEAARLAQLKAEQQAAEQKIAEQKSAAVKLAQLQQKQLVEKQRQAELVKRQQLAQEKIRQEKSLQEKLRQEKALQEKQKLAAQQLAAKKIQKETEKLLQQQLAAEQKELETAQVAQTAKLQGVVDKYKALIQQAISQKWIIPDNANNQLNCKLLIRLAPGGAVLDVQLITSSGDPALDRSARAAVFKASPLPVPHESEVFEQFRELRLTVRPEGMIANR